ncbi:tetratricopeptide repeat protein [Nostoc sp. 'Peltigera membranacea cyanobiont' N6]|uniref:tetratricopeptide repeat protein n=1 Tax=Nostoc sp. 'Peltigera membranacea cyanobiont' N6 TaxID=1261031 RepID=UPI000D0C0A32|nr:tetratricopeptide repeat protein [Nostoc sp. 'Peltigera membranacea cyanobiont' N6]AVH67499.1 TPR repeat-containing protein [Nostoc sp. 'Peltigera membranacea cyanobiont' N6]
MNDTAYNNNSTWNRQVYHRLKLALSLGLRRQLFLSVCDNLHLRNQVAARLHSTLAYPVGQVLYRSSNAQENSTPAYPRLVTLRLNLNDPNPIVQINQWLANYPPPIIGASKDTPGRPFPVPAFQIVGVEHLTKQPVATQRLFLHYLRLSEQYFSTQESSRFLESNLLLWIPRPWLSAIKQSAPQFWRCRTGVFVFAGEPTPATQAGYPERFSRSGSLDLENIEQSIIDESVSQAELRTVATEFKFENNSDFPAEIQENDVHQTQEATPQQQEFTNRSGSGNDNQSLSSLSYVSSELTELVIATINTNSAQNTEDYLQPQQILLEIEELHKNQVPGEILAEAYHRLGTLYRLRIEQGDSTLENLMVAIIAYQEAISYDETSSQLPDILNDLGTLYWMLYRTPPNSEEGQTYIEQAIEFYQLALKMMSPQTHRETYARVQNNLGTAYGDLARFSHPSENWQQAILAYSEALSYRTAEMDSLKYAACQNNLGTAYWHLGQYNQPIVHLKKAIAAYNEALIHYNPKEEPLKYGMIQNNIGTACWNLAQYEQPAQNLQLAINVYSEALKYRTPANVPSACAATQNNLGTAYWHLANLSQTTKQARQNYLQLCISAYEEAIDLAHSLSGTLLSFDLLASYNNLGLAHYQLVIDKSFNGDKPTRSQHLEVALENHLKALKGLSKQPEAYQTTFTYVVKTIRAFHNELGIQGQNLALSKIPSQLLPEILSKL